MQLRWPVPLLLLVAACPGDDGPSTETDTSSPIAGCECIIDEEPADPNRGPEGPTCGDSPCPYVTGECIGYCELDGVFELANPAALECALVALRDRTPGIVVWSLVEDYGVYTYDGYLLVKADGTAVRRQWDREDLTFEVSDAVLGRLPPAAVLDACLAEPDDHTRFDCLRTELEQPTGVCDEGWTCVECL